jgi:hypothetical protein
MVVVDKDMGYALQMRGGLDIVDETGEHHVPRIDDTVPAANLHGRAEAVAVPDFNYLEQSGEAIAAGLIRRHHHRRHEAHHTDGRGLLSASPANRPPGPLVWQHTDRVGTEVVFTTGDNAVAATGSAVVGGPLPYTTYWQAELDARAAVRALYVTCAGGDWSRTLRLARTPAGQWTCRTQQTGAFGASLAGSGHPVPPLPDTDDAGRLGGVTVVRLSDSPIFLSWALRGLRPTPGEKPVVAATLRVLTPSLVVLAGASTYQLIGRCRLRVGGDEPATTYELDDTGLVTRQRARLRLVR